MGIIGSIRKKSWIAVLFVGVAIIAFIIGDLTKNNRGVGDMGKINGQTVTYNRFDELTKEMEENYKRNQGVSQITTDVENQIREQVWQNLVTETLTEAQFEKLGLTVTDAELSDMYLGNFIHPYLRQMFTDPKTGTYQSQTVEYFVNNFENLDTAQRVWWIETEKTVKKDRQQQKYSALIAGGMYMPNAIAKQIAALDTKLSNATILSLPYQSVADGEIEISDADYQNYYKKHKAEFRVYEELRDIDFVAYPIVPTPQDMAEIEASVQKTWEEFQTVEPEDFIFFVNDESAHNYDSTYRKASEFPSPLDSAIAAAGAGSFIRPCVANNEWFMAKVQEVTSRPDSLRISTIDVLNSKVGGDVTRTDAQAKQLADSVLNIVKSGAMTFEEAVAKYSDNPQKDNNGGDMGWQPDGTFGFLNEQIVNTAEGNVFMVSYPNEMGYIIVKVTGKTTPNRKYRVAVISRPIVASEATTRRIQDEANRFAGNNRTHAELVAGAQAQNLQLRNARLTAMQYSMPGVNDAREIIRWAFDDKTEIDAVADQVYLTNDMYIVPALKDVYKVGYATLDQVRPMIENQVRIEKKAEVLKARLEEAKKAKANINAIATQVKGQLDTIDSVSFNAYYLGQYGMEPKVQAAITVAAPNTLVGPIQGTNGVFMFNVNSRTNNPAPAQAENVRGQMSQIFSQGLNGIMQVLKDNGKVVDNRYKFF